MKPHASSRRASAALVLLSLSLNVLFAIAFIRSGAADALWHRVTPELAWRTGPAWSATVGYSILLFVLHALINLPLERRMNIEELALHAVRFVAGCCFTTVCQVLMPSYWQIPLAAVLLVLMLTTRTIDGGARPLRIDLGIWLWIGLGLLCSRWLVPQWTLGSPQHLPRLSLWMTFWIGPMRMVRPDRTTRRMLMWTPNFAWGGGDERGRS